LKDEEIFNFNNSLISSKTKNNILADYEENISLNKIVLVYKNQPEKKELEEVVKKVVLPKKPVFKYVVKRGDTLEKIAKKFKVNISELLEINNLKSKDKLIAGEEILIPSLNLKVSAKVPSKIQKIFPEFISALSEIGNILVPVSGLNQKRIHSNNGVDISAECGTPVYAANSGVVIESSDGWNGGYGNYIVIKHDNFETLYGHLSQRYVEVGDYVEKGTLIGLVGATGKATGCHLHFETRGIKNPLSK
jgi:murein DD-endopeptidase MepM/ murein hydrolase activator NlpD